MIDAMSQSKEEIIKFTGDFRGYSHNLMGEEKEKPLEIDGISKKKDEEESSSSLVPDPSSEYSNDDVKEKNKN